MQVPFLPLKEINETFEPFLSQAVLEAIGSGQYLLGERVSAFEKEYARYCGVNHCVCVANGLDALTIVLRACQQLGMIAEGDEVAVPANTFIATVLAVTAAGMKPVLIDPDESTCLITGDGLERSITPKTSGHTRPSVWSTSRYGGFIRGSETKDL